jgi:anti-anti-sigma regulatory factor
MDSGPQSADAQTVFVAAVDGEAVAALRHAREVVEGDGNWVVDCAALDRMPGPLVQVVLAAERALRASGRSVVLQGLAEPVLDALRIVGAAHLVRSEVTHPAVASSPAEGA